MKLLVLSGGAAEGLIGAVRAQFEAATGCAIEGTFGAVGAMREKLLGGAPADVLVLTAALIGDLVRDGQLVDGSAADVGTVLTAIAVRSSDPAPLMGDAGSLRAALLAADEIHFPDPKLATAGIHFAKILEVLAIQADVGPRLRPHPNGATAMRALAASQAERPIGCTQVTEILNTPGVTLVGPLPREFELATVYTAGVTTRSALPDQARQLVHLLTGEASRELRRRCGFISSPGARGEARAGR